MLELPNEIIEHIIDYFIEPVEFYMRNEVRHIGKQHISLYLGLGRRRKEELFKWKRVYELIHKYHHYQNDYECNIRFRQCSGLTVREKPPLLVDACFSGCFLPLAYSSKQTFTEEVFNDIRDIIRLIPSSLESSYGQMRCRTRVTPLYAAVSNENMPIHVVRYLLEQGANVHDKIHLNNDPIDMLEDLYGNVVDERTHSIEELFKVFSL